MEKVVFASESLFPPANSVRSTCSLVEIHNTQCFTQLRKYFNFWSKIHNNLSSLWNLHCLYATAFFRILILLFVCSSLNCIVFSNLSRFPTVVYVLISLSFLVIVVQKFPMETESSHCMGGNITFIALFQQIYMIGLEIICRKRSVRDENTLSQREEKT